MDVSLKEHLEAIIDLRFQSIDKAVQAALTAQEKSTSAAFASSEKAIVKAEEAQKSYNQTHNDLSRKMDEQYKTMMPREESLGKHAVHETRIQELKEDLSKLRNELMKEISGLRESRSEGDGGKKQNNLMITVISLIIAAIGVATGIIISVVRH